MMLTLKRTLPVFAALVLMLAAAVVTAQQQQPQQPPQSQQAQTARGELLRVDNEAKALVIRTSASEMQFKYTADTRVTGAQEGIAGLGTMAGSQVVVSYTRQGQDNVATQIAVQPRR